MGDGDYRVKLRSAKLMERMVNQNTFDEIYHGLQELKKKISLYLINEDLLRF